jgi:hypothetical protein
VNRVGKLLHEKHDEHQTSLVGTGENPREGVTLRQTANTCAGVLFWSVGGEGERARTTERAYESRGLMYLHVESRRWIERVHRKNACLQARSFESGCARIAQGPKKGANLGQHYVILDEFRILAPIS